GILATTTGDPKPFVEALARQLDVAVGSGDRDALLRGARRELDAYFTGRLRVFATPVDLRLARTPFARAVLEVVHAIPYGELWTYGDVAGAAGRPGAARAAGSVLAHAPIELFVPCHRVAPAGPGFGSYGGEEDRRERLLRLEGAI
ncbi:MAG TPA: methylated-DNA--[protein]-cysteine S-methyltransferase, partial [Actinomycetota bacterium]